MIVYIARMGHDEIKLELPTGTNVAAALRAAHLDLTGREQAFVMGTPAQASSILEDGDVLSVVTPKQAA